MSELAEVLDRLTEVIAEFQSSNPAPSRRREWYPANEETAQLLGYDTYRQLWQAIDSKLLRQGEGMEVSDRRHPGGSKPIYYIHLDRALRRLEIPPEKRKKG